MKQTTKNTCPPKNRPQPPTIDDCKDLLGGAEGPMGPAGPIGDTGPAVSTPFDPSQACSYVQGQIIFYNGGLWSVNQNCPQGLPGSGVDYTLVTATIGKGGTGPTGLKGPTGNMVVLPYDPEQAYGYKKGQLIYYNGKTYQVLNDNPSGLPGSSADYEELANPVISGPTGPPGANGDATSENFDPNMAAYYLQGQLVYYNGSLYAVNKNNPQGIPGASSDYTQVNTVVMQGVTGPTGPTGSSFPSPFDPNEAGNYVMGQVVYYNGNLYLVNKDNPSGFPGSSPDYTLISNESIVGPMGPAGNTVVQPYTPDGIYKQGDLVYYNGNLYGVNRDNPVGPPDQSSDFSLIQNFYSVTGPQGPQGPQGPMGACICLDQIGQNVVDLANIVAGTQNMLNFINDQQTSLDEINAALDNDEQQIQDNLDSILAIENGQTSGLDLMVSSVSYCACSVGTHGCMPYMLNANSANTQIMQYGNPCLVGTFFGCQVYRQCYYGTATADPTTGKLTLNLPVSVGNPTMIVDSGGSWMDIAQGIPILGYTPPAGLFMLGAWCFGAVVTVNTAAGRTLPQTGTYISSGTGTNQNQGTASSIQSVPGTPNNQMQYTVNGTALTTHIYEFWIWVDYITCNVDAGMIPNPTS